MSAYSYDSYAKEDPPRRVTCFENLNDYRYKRCLIGIEEHCGVPFDFPDRPSTEHFEEEYAFQTGFMKDVKNRLVDVELRLKTMDKSGIAAQLLSLAEPGCQGFRADELEKSVRFAKAANEFVYKNYCSKYPERFFGMAAVPTQDGQAAADELERCVKEYGFKGCLINGFTPTANPDDSLYLDMPMYEPFWAKVVELDVPVFIHPRAPDDAFFPLGKNLPALKAPTYGFTRETVEHCIRVMCSGVFDRYPTAKVVLGHLGEGLSFALPRLDNRMRIMKDGSHGAHKKPLGYYFQRNFICLTSGHFTTSALHQLIAETNTANVLYSDDYPFESIEEHVEWWRTIGVGEETWKDMSYRNAIRLFKLPLNFD